MNNFRDLKVWHKSIGLVVDVYNATLEFPNYEKYNIISQMQRAAVSIPSNIAEGCGRHTGQAFKQFLSIALGSAYELETQIIISNKLQYLKDDRFEFLQEKVTEVQRMTFALISKL